VRASKRQVTGIGLLESLLALAIGMTIFVLSLRQYYSYRETADMQGVQSNVDTLFLAAAGYYQANCPQGKLLDPTIATGPVKAINITNDFINAGYLASSFPTPNPLVDSTGPGGGYVVQFNQYTAPRMKSVCSNPPSCTLSTPAQIGTIVIWKIQVAVLMKNTSAAMLANDQNYLAADCLSTVSGSPATSALCSANTPGNYLVFERLPSFVTSNPDAQSELWLSSPSLKQYNQMYTTNPVSDLTNQSHTPEYQYYYCSG
jgi:hypothetical protein